jgi:hypothetical protein
MSKVDITASLGPNCANFIAGIIEGILNSAGMTCKCSAHFVPEEEGDEAIGQRINDLSVSASPYS